MSLDHLTEFYRDLFDFPEVEALRSPFFRCLEAGTVRLNFFGPAAYDRLGLPARRDREGVSFLLHIGLDNHDAVDTAIVRAIAEGAALIQAAGETPYGWYVAVLRDPEGNAFRVGCAI